MTREMMEEMKRGKTKKKRKSKKNVPHRNQMVESEQHRGENPFHSEMKRRNPKKGTVSY